jgi:cell division protein FtsB
MSVKARNWFSRYLGWFLVFFGFYLVLVLSKGVWEMRGAYKRLGEAQINFEKEKDKREVLLRQIEEATSPAYIEKVARDELGMQLEGETLVVLSGRGEGIISNQNQVKSGGEFSSEQNWQKWWRLIR